MYFHNNFYLNEIFAENKNFPHPNFAWDYGIWENSKNQKLEVLWKKFFSFFDFFVLFLDHRKKRIFYKSIIIKLNISFFCKRSTKIIIFWRINEMNWKKKIKCLSHNKIKIKINNNDISHIVEYIFWYNYFNI